MTILVYNFLFYLLVNFSFIILSMYVQPSNAFHGLQCHKCTSFNPRIYDTNDGFVFKLLLQFPNCDTWYTIVTLLDYVNWIIFVLFYVFMYLLSHCKCSSVSMKLNQYMYNTYLFHCFSLSHFYNRIFTKTDLNLKLWQEEDIWGLTHRDFIEYL